MSEPCDGSAHRRPFHFSSNNTVVYLFNAAGLNHSWNSIDYAYSCSLLHLEKKLD